MQKTLFICLQTCLLAGSAHGQDLTDAQRNFVHPLEVIEQKLQSSAFEIFRFKGSRFQNDMTRRVILAYPDNSYMQVKWKRAPVGGEAFNNEPRYELAAYALQKLFLDPSEYVVPPTFAQGWLYMQYKSLEPEAVPTFRKPDIVFFVLQYWLENVDTKNVLDSQRLKTDNLYAHHLGNLNIFSYLVRHSDANEGNVLISKNPANPRLFAVDNGVAFRSEESDRGHAWRELRVKQLPRQTVTRLRKIRPADLKKQLETVAQFEYHNGLIIQVEPTKNLHRTVGVRRDGAVYQFGLTTQEIEDIKWRLAALLKKIDKGTIELF